MIVNLERFVAEEQPRWQRLEEMLRLVEEDPWRALSVKEARELHHLYQRASADLARIATFSAGPEIRRHLESLVARAYAEIHSSRMERGHLHLGRWFAQTLPQTFRRHAHAFLFAVALTAAGAVLGGAALAFDPEAKVVIMPEQHLRMNPAERVLHEEQAKTDRFQGRKASFSGYLMTHNIQVALLAAALGMTWGVGTILLLFYNGVILGAVTFDYIMAGQTQFLLGWLLPHGVVEIPAVLIAGQAGFVLALAILGRGSGEPLPERLRRATPDIVTLCMGSALLLVWAGVVEAFFSQYHEPVIPYSLKIATGLVEGAVLWLFLVRAGRNGANRSQSAR
jgi:uncharacterized membrane protein SpoIIM required for sporulation